MKLSILVLVVPAGLLLIAWLAHSRASPPNTRPASLQERKGSLEVPETQAVAVQGCEESPQTRHTEQRRPYSPQTVSGIICCNYGSPDRTIYEGDGQIAFRLSSNPLSAEHLTAPIEGGRWQLALNYPVEGQGPRLLEIVDVQLEDRIATLLPVNLDLEGTLQRGVPVVVRVYTPLHCPILLRDASSMEPILKGEAWLVEELPASIPTSRARTVAGVPTQGRCLGDIAGHPARLDITPLPGSLWFTAPGYLWSTISSRHYSDSPEPLEVALWPAGTIRATVMADDESPPDFNLRIHSSTPPRELVFEQLLSTEGTRPVTIEAQRIPPGEVVVSVERRGDREEPVLLDCQEATVLPHESTDVSLRIDASNLQEVLVAGLVVCPSELEDSPKVVMYSRDRFGVALDRRYTIGGSDLYKCGENRMCWAPRAMRLGRYFCQVKPFPYLCAVQIAEDSSSICIELPSVHPATLGFADAVSGRPVRVDWLMYSTTNTDLAEAGIQGWHVAGRLIHNPGELIPLEVPVGNLQVSASAKGYGLQETAILITEEPVYMVELKPQAGIKLRVSQNGRPVTFSSKWVDGLCVIGEDGRRGKRTSLSFQHGGGAEPSCTAHLTLDVAGRVRLEFAELQGALPPPIVVDVQPGQEVDVVVELTGERDPERQRSAAPILK